MPTNFYIVRSSLPNYILLKFYFLCLSFTRLMRELRQTHKVRGVHYFQRVEHSDKHKYIAQSTVSVVD